MPGYGFVLSEAGVIGRHAFIDLGLSLLAGIAIFFLKRTGQGLELTGDPFKIVIGEFAPPGLGLAPHLLPLAF